jgi:hypothetical protein
MDNHSRFTIKPVIAQTHLQRLTGSVLSQPNGIALILNSNLQTKLLARFNN